MSHPVQVDEGLLEYAAPRQREYILAVNAHGSLTAGADALGLDKGNIHKAIKAVKRKAAEAGYGPALLEFWKEAGRDSATAAERIGIKREHFLRLLQLAHQDLRQQAIEPAVTPGMIVRETTHAYDADENVTGKWVREGPAPTTSPILIDDGPERNGYGDYVVSGVSTYVGPDGNTRGQWIKTKREDRQRWAAMEAHIQGIRDELPRVEPLAKPDHCDSDLLTVIPEGDPHCGLYAWEEETGARFDLEVFERIHRAATDRLVATGPASAIALYNDKGDSTHADNSKNRTPASNNELDVHGRHGEVVRVSVRLKRHRINRLLEKHEKVIYRLDPGNHDPETAALQTLALEIAYENEPRVEIVPAINPFWYYLFGKNLIGTCHGDRVKGRDLPLVMAEDAREWWGQANYCTWLVGHVHHKDIKEYVGCTVEYVRTLAGSDAWHHKSGYRSRQDIQSIVLHREDAEIERHTFPLKRLMRFVPT